MAMLDFNRLSHDFKTLIPNLTTASVGNHLISPPRSLSLSSRRGRGVHVTHIFKDRRRRGNVSGVRELNRLRGDDFKEVDFDNDDEEEEEEEEEEEGGNEDEVGDDLFVLGLGSRMQKWFENRPSGFGEGKVYDTSIEDKLLEEMKQSRIAQAANINRLKHSCGNVGDNAAGKKLKKKKNEVQVEEDEVVPTGVEVRVGNLPKKKNIHRDLNLAFKGFAGISTIVPAVRGNKKTRDPVCLGFAHVYVETEQDALRFIKTFCGQMLTFGRVQKQIKCEMMNSRTQISAHRIMDENPEVVSQLALPVVDEYPSFPSSLSEEDDVVEAEFQLMDENLEYFAMSDSEDMEADASSTAHRLSLASHRQKEAAVATRPRAKARPNKKVPAVKARLGKIPKLEVPGSAKRLKIREKAVLTGVLSKYQEMAVSVTSDS